jgi:hypothetical protein
MGTQAFIKQPLALAGAFGEIECFPNCFAELNTSLGIIFIANIVVGNIGEIAPAIIKAKLKTAAESKGSTLAEAGIMLEICGEHTYFNFISLYLFIYIYIPSFSLCVCFT